MPFDQDLYQKALRFAAEAHQSQVFPGTELPYLLHLGMVAMETSAALQAEAQHDANLAVCCALLHDTLEDTATTFEALEAAFGLAVANGVLALTKNSALPKVEQMADSLHRIRQQPSAVWLVKLADRITNLGKPPHYWTSEKIKGYAEEGQMIYEALQPASPFLGKRLAQKLAQYPPS